MNKLPWMWLAPLISLIAAWCSVAINLYSQYGNLLQNSTSDHPVCAAGGGLEIHDWFQQTLGNSMLVIGLPTAVAGFVLAWALNLLAPTIRQFIGGSRDNHSFDTLLGLAGTIVWLVVLFIFCPLISSAYVRDAACHQTFFK